MYEWIPLSLGVAAGAAAARFASARARAAFIAIATVSTAFAAGALSGELGESWGFLLFDGGQAFCAAAASLALLRARRCGEQAFVSTISARAAAGDSRRAPKLK
jgi:hypothetical protein